MSNAKVAAIVNEALKHEASERMADRDAMLHVTEQEIDELREIINQLTLRIEILEAGVVPDTSA